MASKLNAIYQNAFNMFVSHASIMFFRHLFKIMALLSGFARVYTEIMPSEKYGENIFFFNGIIVSMVLKYVDNIAKVLQESIGVVKSYLRQFIDV
uniref:Uncharacterized protein n=1 Tax=Cucumis melo TaxID=3656 RepID=A0A9I9EMT0_CUCME